MNICLYIDAGLGFYLFFFIIIIFFWFMALAQLDLDFAKVLLMSRVWQQGQR